MIAKRHTPFFPVYILGRFGQTLNAELYMGCQGLKLPPQQLFYRDLQGTVLLPYDAGL